MTTAKMCVCDFGLNAKLKKQQKQTHSAVRGWWLWMGKAQVQVTTVWATLKHSSPFVPLFQTQLGSTVAHGHAPLHYLLVKPVPQLGGRDKQTLGRLMFVKTCESSNHINRWKTRRAQHTGATYRSRGVLQPLCLTPKVPLTCVLVILLKEEATHMSV